MVLFVYVSAAVSEELMCDESLVWQRTAAESQSAPDEHELFPVCDVLRPGNKGEHHPVAVYIAV